MYQDRRMWFRKGIYNGIPISIGYLSVGFTLGIAAGNAGLTMFQATLTSLLMNASAGEYAAFTLIAGHAGYIEAGLMMVIINARYLLMSCALSQKLRAETSTLHRLLIGFDVTDEIFGVSVSIPEKLSPFYSYGLMAVSMPGWAAGTGLGVLMGDVLPHRAVSALSVGLYGMFLAVIIPPVHKNRILTGLIPISMAASCLFTAVRPFSGISAGARIMILTVLIAAAAAVLFPVNEGGRSEA